MGINDVPGGKDKSALDLIKKHGLQGALDATAGLTPKSQEDASKQEAWQDITTEHAARIAAFILNYFSTPESRRLPYEKNNEMWVDAKSGRDLFISDILDTLTVVTKAELQLEPTKVMHIVLAWRHGQANIYLSGKALEDYFAAAK